MGRRSHHRGRHGHRVDPARAQRPAAPASAWTDDQAESSHPPAAGSSIAERIATQTEPATAEPRPVGPSRQPTTGGPRPINGDAPSATAFPTPGVPGAAVPAPGGTTTDASGSDAAEPGRSEPTILDGEPGRSEPTILDGEPAARTGPDALGLSTGASGEPVPVPDHDTAGLIASGPIPTGQDGGPRGRDGARTQARPRGEDGERLGSCTAAQLRRFIKSRPYVPLHELRRRFGITSADDEVARVELAGRRVFVGLPVYEAGLLSELLRTGDIGYELSVDPATPIVVGVFPMRPVARA